MLKTPLHKFHLEYNAKMVDFTGWEMPMMYTGIRDEHQQVQRVRTVDRAEPGGERAHRGSVRNSMPRTHLVLCTPGSAGTMMRAGKP